MDTDSALLPLKDYEQFRRDFPDLHFCGLNKRSAKLGDFEEELESKEFKKQKEPYENELRALVTEYETLTEDDTVRANEIEKRGEQLMLVIGIMNRFYVSDVYIMSPKFYYVEPKWKGETQNDKIKSKIKGINTSRDKLVKQGMNIVLEDVKCFELFNTPNEVLIPLSIDEVPNTKHLFNQMYRTGVAKIMCSQLKRDVKGVNMRQHYLIKELTIKDFEILCVE